MCTISIIKFILNPISSTVEKNVMLFSGKPNGGDEIKNICKTITNTSSFCHQIYTDHLLSGKGNCLFGISTKRFLVLLNPLKTLDVCCHSSIVHNKTPTVTSTFTIEIQCKIEMLLVYVS